MRILVVEDDRLLNHTLSYNLKAAGYIVDSALTRVSADHFLRKQDYDLIVMDVNLPDGNGFDFCQEIKERRPDSAVIFLTANDMEKDMLKGYELGAEDYVTKPFLMSVFQKKVAVSGKPLAFTPLEYRLLKILVKNPQIVLTRQVLLEKLWDADGNFVDEHALTAAISRVRNKIETESRKYIKTVYGMGYMWIRGSVLPADTFCRNWPDHTLRKLFLNVDDAHMDAVQSQLDDYVETTDGSLPVISRRSMAQQYERETRSSAVMGNAVSIVIAFVGVLNFVNLMVTAIVSRKREFAMIQSIGMTKKQLCKMLVFEGIFYAVITLAVSYLLSSLAVGVVIRGITAGGFTTFRFTLLPLNICAPLLLGFAALIPLVCFKNLEKQSIVERLRME